MKIKAKKAKIGVPKQLVVSEEMTDIEKESLQLAEIANTTQTEMAAFYIHMLWCLIANG